MNNSRRLNINKDKDEINKDYFVFTLDLKNDKELTHEKEILPKLTILEGMSKSVLKYRNLIIKNKLKGF